MGWVDIKSAAKQLNKGERAIQIAIERATKGGKPPPYQYRYVDGMGRGGKKLEIYIDEGGKDGEERKTTVEKIFYAMKRRDWKTMTDEIKNLHPNDRLRVSGMIDLEVIQMENQIEWLNQQSEVLKIAAVIPNT